MKSWILHCLAAALAVVSFSAIPVQAGVGTLDGRVFIADAGEKGKAADEKNDVITFAEGKFHSSACDQYGFGKGTYRATTNGEAVAFEAETTSEKDGRLVWKGTVRGFDIEGTFVHYPKGGFLNSNPEPIEHWFKGRVKS